MGLAWRWQEGTGNGQHDLELQGRVGGGEDGPKQPHQMQLGHQGHKGEWGRTGQWDWTVKGFKGQIQIWSFILQELGRHQRHFYLFIFCIKELRATEFDSVVRFMCS